MSVPDDDPWATNEPPPVRRRSVVLPVVLPLGCVAAILLADQLEGPKTAFVGVLTAVPFLAAVFATPLQTLAVGVVTWLSAFGFGHIASDGNVTAQQVRLAVIAVAVAGAVAAAAQRQRLDEEALDTQRQRDLVATTKREAATDVLTGVHNRRGMVEALEALHRDRPWTLATIDCDQFKGVNDALGHQVGDEYLQALALRLSRALSAGDVVGRWGGDEFLVALPLPVADAASVLRRVHAQVTRDALETSAGPVRISLTMGVAPWWPDQSYGQALREADRAMYAGKQRGLNEVVVAEA